MTTQLQSPAVGDTVTCSETGERFTIQRDGHSLNYATRRDGRIVSDRGAAILQRRALLDRARPFPGYLSSDERHLTDGQGNILGTVTWSRPVKLPRWSYVSGYRMVSVRVRDVHGGLWYGRGAGGGMSINLRPAKGV